MSEREQVIISLPVASITFPSIIAWRIFFSPQKEHTCQAFCNESFTSFVALTILCSPFPVKDSTHCGLRLFLLIFFFPNTLVQLDLQILYVTLSLTLLFLPSRFCLLYCLLFSKLPQPGTFLFFLFIHRIWTANNNLLERSSGPLMLGRIGN